MKKLKAKVALVRGTSLNPWEARCFQLLQKDFAVIGITSLGNKYDLMQTTLPLKRLYCPGEVLCKIPGMTRFFYTVYGSPQILNGLQKTIAGFDLVESAEIFNYYTYQAVQAKKQGLVKKVGLTVWENIPFNSETTPKAQAISDYVIKNADFFIAGTKSAYEAMLIRGIDKRRIVDIIPMSEDTDFFKKRRITGKKNEFIFLCASRLVWEKGIQDVLWAFKLLSKQFPNIRLWIVGEGNYQRELISLVTKLKLNRVVTFKKQISYFDLPKLYNQADAFILPSLPSSYWQEQFGMTIIQAMGCQIPVIGSTSGSIPELIGDAGLLYPAGSITELSEQMKVLVENPSLYNKYAKSGRKRIKKYFDYRLVAQKRLDLYHQLL